jgi:hypothetical protein
MTENLEKFWAKQGLRKERIKSKRDQDTAGAFLRNIVERFGVCVLHDTRPTANRERERESAKQKTEKRKSPYC